VFAAAGVDADEATIARYHGWWEPHTLTDPDVPELFAGLRARGLRIGVLSNTHWPREHHERIFERDQVLSLLDGAVYSCELPVTKPHPDAFRAALRAVGVDDPSRAVFVGDRPYDDISGAKAVGMRAVLIPHSDIPEWQVGPVSGEADAVIGRLLDLLDVLDEWAA
jgi:putative hydrolase of the HAD superfamily